MKRKLYRLTRTLRTPDWPKYLRKIVQGINNTPNRAIGNLRPSEIKSPIDDPKIDAVVGIPEDVPFKVQRQKQQEYTQDKSLLQVGDYVYMDFPTQALDKSFDSPVGIYSHMGKGRRERGISPF